MIPDMGEPIIDSQPHLARCPATSSSYTGGRWAMISTASPNSLRKGLASLAILTLWPIWRTTVNAYTTASGLLPRDSSLPSMDLGQDWRTHIRLLPSADLVLRD